MLDIRTSEHGQTRPCKYSLAMQDDSVFADFDLEGDVLNLVRISFDGYGCCTPGPDPGLSRFSKPHSGRLIEAIKESAFRENEVQDIIRSYLLENSAHLWPEALQHHNLI